jgi:hypothetical protein
MNIIGSLNNTENMMEFRRIGENIDDIDHLFGTNCK